MRPPHPRQCSSCFRTMSSSILRDSVRRRISARSTAPRRPPPGRRPTSNQRLVRHEVVGRVAVRSQILLPCCRRVGQHRPTDLVRRSRVSGMPSALTISAGHAEPASVQDRRPHCRPAVHQPGRASGTSRRCLDRPVNPRSLGHRPEWVRAGIEAPCSLERFLVVRSRPERNQTAPHVTLSGRSIAIDRSQCCRTGRTIDSPRRQYCGRGGLKDNPLLLERVCQLSRFGEVGGRHIEL